MKKRMEQLLNGKYEYDVPSLILSPDSISVTTVAGENYRGDLHISTSNNSAVKGILLSSDRRLVLGKEKFSGNTIQIPFGFEVTGMEPGDEVHGELTVSSNIGEYNIPFSLSIEAEVIETSSGEILNLDEFAALSARDYREAFSLFTNENFPMLLTGEYAKYLCLYEALTVNPVSYQNLDEFLIGIGKKEQVTLALTDTGRAFHELPESTKNVLTIHKKNWGYLHADVEAVGDFIQVEKHLITGEDFIGSVFGLEYIIRKDKLTDARQYGKILIKTVYQTLEFNIEASLSSKILVNINLVDKKNKVMLTRNYLAFMLGKMEKTKWAEETLKNLKEMKETGHYYDVHMLYEAYVYKLMEEEEHAKKILRGFSNRAFSKGEWELAAFYLYLCKLTGFLPEDKVNVLGRIRDMAERQEDDFWILWMYLKVNPDLDYSPVKKLYMLEKQFQIGCRSPFLYYEAYLILEKEVTQLHKMTAFMTQVLLFASRVGIMNREVTMRVADLSRYDKRFDESVYKILERGYRDYPADDILEAICKLIMKGNPERKIYFKWYERALEREIRLTRLYEYYMETIEENYQKMLPQQIRLYFAYSNNLSDKKKAYLFANIVANKNMDRETYDIYKESMERFTVRKLQEGRFNQNYAVLYQEFIRVIKERSMGEAISRMMFTYKLYCDDPKVHSVVVHHREFEKEQVFPCVNGVAYILVYTRDAKIIFQDVKKRRYYNTVEYSLQKLFDGRDLVSQCLNVQVKDPGFVLFNCENGDHPGRITLDNINCYQRVLTSHVFREEYKQMVRQKLLEYYAEHAGDDTLDDYLQEIHYKNYGNLNKVILMEVLIERGLYKEAFDMACEFGYEHVDVNKLLRLCSRIILNSEFKEDEELNFLAAYVFRQGKYDDVILTYLTRYFVGCVRDMYLVWESAEGFQLDTYDLTERLMIYAMFVREYPPHSEALLHSYIRHGGKEQVLVAYLSFEAYGYFLGNRQPDRFIYQCLENIYEREWESNVICRLALIKYYIELKNLSEKQRMHVEKILTELNQKGIRLQLFQQLPKELIQPYQLDDRVFVEQKAFPKDKVVLHYVMSNNGQKPEEEDFLIEPMKNTYLGIFSKEFVLFYGEALTYYFTIEHEGKIITTRKKRVTVNHTPAKDMSKYNQLNRILETHHLQKEELLGKHMQQYLFYEKITQEGFELVGTPAQIGGKEDE
ncbi:MAG: DUF5717 family protein [Lachnospiraceae bacterium]|nr:DUF5717 family protein [Lachnospiraceae bacterium]